jgi:peptidyl-prolyl cis-trans isomerase D
MRQLRQNTKIIMILVAITFVALMVFEWGMNMSGRTAGGTIGRVGGTSVSVLDFQNSYRVLYDQVQAAQEQPISSQQDQEIEDMAWEQVVNQILIQEELARRGIRVTDEEVRQAARMSPPPEFQSDPAFQNEQGQFDLVRYQQFLDEAGQDPLFLQQLELYYRDLILRNKLIRQVTSGVFLSDAELWRRYREENEQATATFVAVSPDTRVPDSEVPVTEDQVRTYYEENEEDFQVPARANVRYVYMNKAPSAADTAAALERARAVHQEVTGGADFATVATRESSDTGSAALGGSLGTFGRGTMVPEFDTVAFNMEVGEISDPFRSQFGYHIVQVEGRDEAADRVEARHILIPIELTDESEVRLLTRADSLETLAEGQTLEGAASTFGLTVLDGEITEETAVLSGVGLAGEAQDWIFEEAEGEGSVSPVFETDAAFYAVEIVDLLPAGVLTFDEARAEIENDLRIERKTDLTMEEAAGWAGELRSGAVTLEALADRIGVAPQTQGPFTRIDFVPGLGISSPAIGAAFGVPPGEIAGPARAFDAVVVMRVDSRVPADSAAWEAQKAQQRSAVTSEIQQARLDLWLDGLRETTRIVDNRIEYFRLAEEAAEQGLQNQLMF